MSPDGATPSTGFASGSTIDLAVTGMTCAACAARIERRLNRVPGLEATVNYATERARITVDAELLDERGVGGVLDDCVATIVDVGYGAAPTDRDDPAASARRLADLRRRLWLASALGLPVLALSMMPGLQFDGWQWVALALALPVSTWAAWPTSPSSTATTPPIPSIRRGARRRSPGYSRRSPAAASSPPPMDPVSTSSRWPT